MSGFIQFLHCPWRTSITFCVMSYHINKGHFPTEPIFCQAQYYAPNQRNSDFVILGKQLAPGHIFMCIPYIFLNFMFLLIATPSGLERLNKSLVFSCPNTSLITFTAWVLETLLPSALGPKFFMHKAKPDHSLMVTVCSCPGQLWHHYHAWQDNSWWLGLY